MIYWFENDSNYVMVGKQLVFLMSLQSSRGCGFYMNNNGSRQAIGMFSAKRLALDTWITHDDLFISPNRLAQNHDS
jgi:hypothetical protein